MAASPLAQLGAELTQVGEFLALLEREQVLLTRADTEALLPLIETKSAMAGQLADFSQARESALQALKLPPGREGVQAWIERSGTAVDRKQWQQLLELATRIRTLNEMNGKLIGLHMQKNQQAFSALMAAANRTMTYGPDGQQQNALGGRILGTA